MRDEQSKKYMAALDVKHDKEIESSIPYYISFNNSTLAEYPDIINAFIYIYFAQLFAFTKSESLGFNPDNPCPSGEVSRVVHGVIIYPYEKK